MWGIIASAVFCLAIYGIVLLARKNKNYKWEHPKCNHVDEPNHDRIGCYQRQLMGIWMIVLMGAIVPKH